MGSGRIRWCVAGVAACIALASAEAWASRDPAARSVVVPRLERSPVVDGVLSEGEWAGAAVVTLDQQVQPGDNAAPSESTDVYLAYDAEHLFVAFHARDSDPSAIRARVSRRDAVYADDYVALYLDTFDDRRRAYVFYFNPLGIQADGIITGGTYADTAQVGDLTWDGLLTSRGRVVDDGYVVEAAIPFRTLRYGTDPVQTWGLHLQRWIARKAERVHWQPISRDQSEFLLQMGALTGITGLAGQRLLDVIPTVTGARSERAGAMGDHGLRTLSTDGQFDLGVSANYTLTPSLTLSGTANPDFSQIEADVPQIDVNQRFALFYPELRPFFLEGGEVFRSAGIRQFVNTRQIIDPDWGLKLTGKVGRQQVGLLAASDRAPGLQVTDPQARGLGRNAMFLIGRVRRDIGQASRAGLFVTDRRWADGSHTMLAVDGEARFQQVNTIGYQLGAARSRSPEGVATAGSTSYVWHDLRSRHLRILTRGYHTSPDYEMQAGFQRRAGVYGAAGNYGWEWQADRDTWWVSVRPFVVPVLLRTWRDGRVDESFVDPGVDLRFARNISLYTYLSWSQDTFAGRKLAHQAAVVNYTVDTFKTLSFSGNIRRGEGPFFDPVDPRVGHRMFVQQTMRLQPGPSLSTSLLLLVDRVSEQGTGAPLVRQTIVRNRTTYQFSRAYSARALLDYDSARRRFGASLLAAWEPRPNTAVFVGYNDLLSRQPGEREFLPSGRLNRTYFFKVSYGYRWRPGDDTVESHMR
jgi:hypothetical protein